ncbi:unnamed protein product [Parascedosporium putredinis]|uniref:YAG7-like dimerisation domain-containing protein n=1 Tax=Parascedosporium putredinis TaxID=1442378 RepID=A0A9P1MDE3_9PEZI|nr:unnamed protein product [Parascedosporium putredinis]CAI7999491.1 unnamed protein product [Parascedosporium putredinis]
MAAPAAKSAPSGAKVPQKKVKVIDRTASPAPSASAAEKDGGDDQENAYIRELQKNIRNVTKKITNASKTDSLLKEHAGKSLEELVSTRIINADQRAQILKKPALEAQLAQYEEQLVQYKKIDAEYRSNTEAQVQRVQTTLTEKFEKEKADAVREIQEKAEADIKTSLHDSLLIVSQFLRLAAARRIDEESDPGLDENLALEGILSAVYCGDENAVTTMLKLVEGTNDRTQSTAGEELESTFSHVKSVSQAYLAQYEAAQEEAEAKPEGAAESESANVDAAAAAAAEATPAATEEKANGDLADAESNGAASAPEEPAVPEVAADLSASQEWVSVPRPTETESSAEGSPVVATNGQSWADDHPEPSPVAPAAATPAAPADPNDGFHQVQGRHHRGRNEREGGNWRGRGRGDWRGRGGHRGDGRGRRGGPEVEVAAWPIVAPVAPRSPNRIVGTP